MKATEADLAANPMDEDMLQQELESLRQRIPEFDSVQTPVCVEGVFECDPVIKKIERSRYLVCALCALRVHLAFELTAELYVDPV